MSKKVIIQIIVIVGAFGAAGYVLYTGLFNSNNNAAVVQMTPIQETKVVNLFPYGEQPLGQQLQENLDPTKFQYNAMDNPAVDPLNEVGKVPDSSMIPPLPQSK
jgi:Flp pilus assembly protein CpaB